ncbi:MAG: hypothetical protein J6W13_05175 [Salinivirgaceae bacterium]|nr:hypothetical protein [Salinivirgaceae bacterium]
MKKILLSAICIAACAFTANAQLGSSMLKQAASKAAKKTTEKTIEKATDRISDKASDAIDKEIEKGLSSEPSQSQSQSQAQSQEPVKPQSIIDIMKQLPAVPTVQQLANYKSAELNEQTIRLMASPVMSFKTKSTTLAIQAMTFSYANADSAQVMETAYKQAEMMTGLTREEIDKLSEMSEEEQQAYLEAHYKQGQAEAALLEQAADAGEYLEPLQPLIDEWDAIGKKVEGIFADADNQCKTIYAKYAKDLENQGEAYKSAALKYYTEIAPIQRKAVLEAMKIRMDEQIPAAEKIEKEMIPIRAEHHDIISALLNYPQLTATQYFTDTEHLFGIPTYK